MKLLDSALGASPMIDNVTPQEPREQIVTIGEFARLSRLTTKALRVYDKLGLLRPVAVDPSNRYRRYSVDQVRTASLIGLLRGADMSLNEIAKLLTDLDSDQHRAAERLDHHASNLESQHTGRRVLIRHIHSILRQEDHPMFTIHTRHQPAQRVMSIQRRLRAPETDSFVSQAKAAFAEHLSNDEAIGPFTVIFHGIVDNDHDGPIEAILGCPENVQPNNTIGVRTEPAHDQAYTTITKSQWEFPAILAAYDAVACSPEPTSRSGSPLSCREIYIAEPDDIGNDDPICDIAFPLA